MTEMNPGVFEGPYANLVAAFNELESDGIVARMDFTCCQNCGFAEIGDERTEIQDAAAGQYPYSERGFTFFHAQDADRLAEGDGRLYLSYGAFPGGPLSPQPQTQAEEEAWEENQIQADISVGTQVVQALERFGFVVDWDGDINTRIAIDANWSAAPFPWERDDDWDEDFDDEIEEFPPYNPSFADNAWYLLLDSHPNDLGELLQDFLPNYSAGLSEDHAIRGEVPNEETGVTIWMDLVDRIGDPDLAEHATRSEFPTSAETRVKQHQAALCLRSGGRASALEQVITQSAFAAELSSRPEVLATWMPNQERVELRAELFLDEQPPWLPHLWAHQTYREFDEAHMLYTRGMKRFGFMDLFIAADDPIPEGMGPVLTLFADQMIAAGRQPEPGEIVKIGFRKVRASVHEGTDPVTDEPALNLVLLETKKFLGLF